MKKQDRGLEVSKECCRLFLWRCCGTTMVTWVDFVLLITFSTVIGVFCDDLFGRHAIPNVLTGGIVAKRVASVHDSAFDIGMIGVDAQTNRKHL